MDNFPLVSTIVDLHENRLIVTDVYHVNKELKTKKKHCKNPQEGTGRRGLLVAQMLEGKKASYIMYLNVQ